MIIDHRTYTLHPGTIKKYLAMYEEEGLPLQRKYLGEPVGYFISMDIGMLNQVIHMWGYENLTDRDEKRQKLGADPEWGAYLAKVLPMVQTMENKILTPTAFSGIK